MTTTLARKPPPRGDLVAHLREAAPRLAAALPATFTPEKMIQLLSVVIYKTPKLQECDPESVITAAIQAGSLDLDLNPGMCEAFLIPRWNKNTGTMEAQFQPGFQGLAKLAVRTGSVRHIQPAEVCEGDAFRLRRDPDTSIVHEVDYKAPRGKVTHVYAVAKLADGERAVEVMSAEEVEGIRARSQYPNAGPWASDWKEMALKTVVKRLCKRLPRSQTPAGAAAFDRLQSAIDADNREYLAAPEAPEHHAINHDNKTGHGSGAYAPPEVVADYQAWLKGYAAKVNAAWSQRVNRVWDLERGDPPKGAEELTNVWQLGGHLLKFFRAAGAVEAPEEERSGQRDKLTAVVWMRDQAALKGEAKRYVGSLASVKWAKLFPEPEEPTQAPPVEAEDDSQDCDPDIDLPPEREPGCDDE